MGFHFNIQRAGGVFREGVPWQKVPDGLRERNYQPPLAAGGHLEPASPSQSDVLLIGAVRQIKRRDESLDWKCVSAPKQPL